MILESTHSLNNVPAVLSDLGEVNFNFSEPQFPRI